MRTPPFLLSAFLLVGSLTPMAHAEPKPAAAPATKGAASAHDLYEQGRDLFRKSQFDKARAAFVAAYAIRKHWQILGFQGLSELKLGRYRDAAEHLQTALHTVTTEASAVERQSLQAGYEEAKQKIAEVRIVLDEPSADLLVDNVTVGTSPMPDPIFLEAGSHMFEARKSGKTLTQSFLEVAAGRTYQVQLQYLPASNTALPTPQAATNDAPAEPAPSPPMPTPRPAAASASAEPVPWRTVALIGGLGATAVAVGIGAGFALKGSSSDDDAVGTQKEIGLTSSCPAHPKCGELAGLLEDRNSANSTARVFFIAGGVLAAATLATYFLWSGHHGESSVAVQAKADGSFLIRGTF